MFVARLGDMHVCPMVTPAVPPVPHVGGPILPPCAFRVLIGNRPAAPVGNTALCTGPPDFLLKCNPRVLVSNRPVVRMGDTTAHGGTVILGCFTVFA